MKFWLLALTLLAPLSGATAENYTWRNVAIGGGGFVTGVVFHPTERGLAYARTDVGGAYRWDDAAQTWVPLLDGLGQADWNLQGVESLAVDPADPSRVYLVAGTYTAPDVSNGEVFRSTDRGATWQRTALPFKCGANEAGRGSGERLMVDPNSPNLLYLGTRRDGLWYSTDHGTTWARLPGFPNVPDESVKFPLKPGERYNHLSQAVGVIWVKLDASRGQPGQPTPVVYAAVSRTGESIYRSSDAGATWSPLPGQPTTLRPTGAALAPNGTLYVTYADEPGPTQMRNGAVWKFEPAGRKWTELSPEPAKPTADSRGFGYATVNIDPADPSTLLVTTWNRQPRDEIFRSTNDGRTWRSLMATATWDHTSAPYTQTMAHHWMSDVEIDPANRDRIIFNTGYGLWASTNATATDHGAPVHWVFHNRGLEETVPLALISPPEGAHLLSGVGDIDGFVHDDFTVSPAAGRFAAPGYKNTEWLDYAALQPRTIVRSGTTYKHDRIHAAVSDDGGRTWAALATEPPHPADSQPFTTGPVALSADGKIITWTPSGDHPVFTTDRGKSWSVTKELPVNARVIGDRVDPRTLYGYDAATGAFFVSTDGAATFLRSTAELPTVAQKRGGHDFGALVAVPGFAGETWLAAGGQLFRLTKRGAGVHPFPALKEVSSDGFGRAAPGADYPAVFIVGTVDAGHGVYRSDDGGTTWVRLTDDAHQFGSASRVTGDPRVFGRVYFCTSGRGIIYGERSP